MRHTKFRPDSVAGAIRTLLRKQGLNEEIERLAAVTRIWDGVADASLRKHAWVESWDGTVLTIGVGDPGSATRLRFEADELAGRLRAHGLPDLQELRPVVRPVGQRNPPPRHRRYSPEAAARVADSAAEVADQELRAALLRLADHLHTPPGEDSGAD
ncbi:MAG: DciA family protein [Thiohalorhabdus sp.]|uniref:DciA family protein n=1 Tax=Thiohalorhabdus sp. TaxID=3094134 RepID=UPI00397EB896